MYIHVGVSGIKERRGARKTQETTEECEHVPRKKIRENGSGRREEHRGGEEQEKNHISNKIYQQNATLSLSVSLYPKQVISSLGLKM